MHTYKINNFVEVACLIEKLRIIKDNEEINSIKEEWKIKDK